MSVSLVVLMLFADEEMSSMLLAAAVGVLMVSIMFVSSLLLDGLGVVATI